jgi:hypothetical protein
VPDLDLRLFALRDVEDDAFPLYAPRGLARTATHVDPFDLVVRHRQDAPLPVPEGQILGRILQTLLVGREIFRMQQSLEQHYNMRQILRGDA